MSKKLHIISEYFYPSDNSTSYYITEISRALSLRFDVNVLCNTQLESNAELDFIEGHVSRARAYNYNKNNVVSRVLYFLFSSLIMSWKVFFQVKKGEYILAVTNPAFLIVFLALLRKIRKFNFTLLAYDVFPENVFASGLMKKNSFIYKVSLRIFDWAYSQADHIIVIGRDMQKVLERKVNSSDCLSLITNWCDTKRVQPCSKKTNKIIKSLQLDDNVVFSFVGNFGRVQGIQNLLDAAKLVTNKKFILLFIGDGAMKSNIENHIGDNVIYGGSFPPSEENVFLNACDVALVSLSPAMYGLGVPSKSYHNMAAKKPILFIGQDTSEIGQVIQEYDIGWVIEPNNPKALAEKFEELCECGLVGEKGLKARWVVDKFYSKDVVLRKYQDFFSRITSD